jgi:cytochrome c
MNTMEITKIVGALCGSLLVFLLIQTAGSSLFYPGTGARRLRGRGGGRSARRGGCRARGGGRRGALVAEADAGAGEAVWRRCQACHVLEDGQNRVGPHLYGVVGRDIAAVDGFNYSAALTGIEGPWDYEALYGFLRNPREWAPGTSMNFAGLANSDERANVIAYIEQFGN